MTKLYVIPYSGGALTKREGLNQGPEAVLKAVKELPGKENGTPIKYEEVKVQIDQSNAELSRKAITAAINEPGIIIAGDHSATKPIIEGIKKEIGLVIFDAHPDVMDSEDTHEDYLRGLIETGKIKPENVILVGIRSYDPSEIQYLKSKNITYYTMKEIQNEGLQEVSDSVMAKARQFPSLYVSIDIDVVDPSQAPGTGYREPGGLSSRELIHFVQRLKNLKNLEYADIVEINPTKDHNQLTVNLGARLIAELL